MAEVAEFHLALDGFEDEEDDIEPGSISYWPYEFEHEDIYSSGSDRDRDQDPFSRRFGDDFIPSEQITHFDSFGSDSDSVTELNEFIRQDHHEEVNPNLVSDLFARCIEEEEEENLNRDLNTPFDQDPFFRIDGENNETGSFNYLDLGLGLDRIDEEEDDVDELRLRLDRIDEEEEEGDIDDGDEGFMIDNDEDDICSGDFFVSRRCESGRCSEIGGGSGRRIVLDSEDEADDEIIRARRIVLDSEDEADDGIIRGRRIVLDSEDEADEEIIRAGDEDGLGEVQDDLGIPLCWDCLQLDDRSEVNDINEWEEVTNRIEERDELSVMMDFEERSVSTSLEIQEVVEGREESMHNSEWEFLLQINNLERNEEDSEHDFDHEDYTYPAEYETLFGQFAENENAIRGSPPTSKHVLENLPSIVLTEDDIKNKGSLCAVCKDEISSEEQTKLLPCSHYYHGDCILPWLNIRNTCPVCRFELATDDPEYERRRTQRDGRGSSGLSLVRYEFQMFTED